MKWKKNEVQNSEARVEKLADEVRSTAQQSMEALWSAFLEVGELDMVRATEKALRLMVSHGDCTGAMKVLEGVYALYHGTTEESCRSILANGFSHDAVVWTCSDPDMMYFYDQGMVAKEFDLTPGKARESQPFEPAVCPGGSDHQVPAAKNSVPGTAH